MEHMGLIFHHPVEGSEAYVIAIFFDATLPETNSSPMKIPMFPCKYHQNDGFSLAMLVLGRVI